MDKICTRCSRKNDRGGQICSQCYDERSKAVYWDKEAACGDRGPTKARCLLEVGHGGEHEGNGYDDYGPLGRRWAPARKRANPMDGHDHGDEDRA